RPITGVATAPPLSPRRGEISMMGVARTALLVAASRAREDARPDALFRDPLARVLAGEDGFETLRAAEASHGGGPMIAIRTHFLDARLLTVLDEQRLTQVVIVAAGM